MNYEQYTNVRRRMGISLTPEEVGDNMAFEQVMGNIMWRPTPLPKKGDQVGDHEHTYDHVSFITAGSVRIVARDRDRNILWEKDFAAGDPSRDRVLVKAEVSHEITALEDNSFFYCIYAHRSPQGDVVQEYNGYETAYR